jgi:hypothetical protein
VATIDLLKTCFVSLDTATLGFLRRAWPESTYGRRSLGIRFALPRYAKRNGMLKISVIDSRTGRRMLLEEKLIAPWVAELRTVWKAANEEMEDRALVVDLRNITVISPEGENALSELMTAGARFRCSGVLIKYVLKQLARKKRQELPRR